MTAACHETPDVRLTQQPAFTDLPVKLFLPQQFYRRCLADALSSKKDLVPERLPEICFRNIFRNVIGLLISITGRSCVPGICYSTHSMD